MGLVTILIWCKNGSTNRDNEGKMCGRGGTLRLSSKISVGLQQFPIILRRHLTNHLNNLNYYLLNSAFTGCDTVLAMSHFGDLA